MDARAYLRYIIFMLNRELLKILACPKCLAELTLTGTEDGLICRACSLVYPIREEIPVLLIDQALNLEHYADRDKKE